MAFNSTVASTISVFYAAALGRTPVPDSSLPDFGDIEGLAFWTDAFLAGEGVLAQYNDNIYAIAEFFVASDEFETRYPETLTAEEYVTALYNNLLGRSPDADGLVFWVGELEGGASRGKILADFTNSEEAQEFNPTQQAAMQSFITLLAANEGMMTPEQATEWVTENPTLDAAVIDNPEAPTLTLAAALEALAADELPEQYLIDSTEPLDAGAVAVADAQAVYPQVVEVLTGALNAAALPADLFAWAILDTATNILAAVEDPAVTGAGSVALSEGVSVAQITPISAVANFDGVYAVADTLTNLTEQPASVIALINGATEIAVTGQIAIADLAQVTTLYGDKVTSYNLLDTAANLTDEANADIVAAATSIEVDGAVTVAEHAALIPLLGADFGYTLADTFANLLAAPELVAGATTYALTDEPGSLGRLLDEEQVALLEGATNAADFTFATLSFAAAAPTINEGNALAFTVTLSEPVTAAVTVNFQLNAGDPTGPNTGTNLTNLADFETGDFNPATVIIPAGATTATFNATPLNDGITELPEGFSVTATVASVAWTDEVEATVLDGTGPTGGQIFNLTVNQDTIPGMIGSAGTTSTAGNDTINALAFQDGAGNLINTLQNVDSIDAGAGDDVLNVTLAEGTKVTPSTVAATIRNVETINVRFANEWATLDLANTTGATALSVADSTTVAQVKNVGGIANLGVKNQTQNVEFAGSKAGTLNFDFANVTSTVTVNKGATTANVTMNKAAVTFATLDTIETLTVAATAGANTLNTGPSKDAITTATVTGAGSLTLTTAFTALTKLEGGANTGGITATVNAAAETVTTGDGKDTITYTAALAADTKVDLGAGDDTFTIAGVSGKSARVDGGVGSNTLKVTNGTWLDTNAKEVYSNFQTLEIGGGTGTYNLDHLPGITAVTIGSKLTGPSDITKAAAGTTVTVNARGVNDLVDKNLSYALKDATGTKDAVTLTLNGSDGVNDGAAKGQITVPQFTANDIETFNIASNITGIDATLKNTDYTHTIDLQGGAVQTIVVTGNANLTVDNTAADFAKITKIDASAATGEATFNAKGATQSVEFLGGAANDTYIASGKGDVVVSSLGQDDVTLAAGEDTLVYTTADHSRLTATGDAHDQIDAFTSGDDTIDLGAFNFSSGVQTSALANKGLLGTPADVLALAGAVQTDFFVSGGSARAVAVGNDGANTYVFVDVNKDGNFDASTDMVIELSGPVPVGLTPADFGF